MGYLTNYKLDWTGDLEELPLDFEGVDYAFDKYGEDSYECKWYDHEKDCIELSKVYPEILFTLSGEGEEAGDLWIKYFKNGKMQRAEAKITYDEFDENKLE